MQKSPVPGQVVWIPKPAEIIQAGGVVAIISAMKMEHSIKCTSGGRVERIIKRIGDTVKKGDNLLLIHTLETETATTTPTEQTEQTAAKPEYNHIEQRLERLRNRKHQVQQMGGASRVKKQQSKGKYTARERIDIYTDSKSSFTEIGSAAGNMQYSLPLAGSRPSSGKDVNFTPTNFIFGLTTIGARDVILSLDDYTINASHTGGNPIMLSQKYILAEKLCLQYRIPYVRILDGASGGGSVNTVLSLRYSYAPMLPGYANTIKLLQTVPVVSVCTGSVIGLGAVKCSASHFRILIRQIGSVSVAGATVVRGIYNNSKLTQYELGGPDVSGPSGFIDCFVDTEEQAAEKITKFLSYFPSSVGQKLPISNQIPPILPPVCLDEIFNLTDDSEYYEKQQIINSIVDANSELEISPESGKEVACYLVRVSGRPFGFLIAGDPMGSGGALTAIGARKVKRFLDMCDQFGLSIITFVDMPGIAVGVDNEKSNTLDAVYELSRTIYSFRGSWFSIIARRCYGVGGALFIDGPNVHRAAWPTASWGSLPTSSGKTAAKVSAKHAAANSIDWKELTNPIRTVEAFGIEEMIRPRDTPHLIRRWASFLDRNCKL